MVRCQLRQLIYTHVKTMNNNINNNNIDNTTSTDSNEMLNNLVGQKMEWIDRQYPKDYYFGHFPKAPEYKSPHAVTEYMYQITKGSWKHEPNLELEFAKTLSFQIDPEILAELADRFWWSQDEATRFKPKAEYMGRAMYMALHLNCNRSWLQRKMPDSLVRQKLEELADRRPIYFLVRYLVARHPDVLALIDERIVMFAAEYWLQEAKKK